MSPRVVYALAAVFVSISGCKDASHEHAAPGASATATASATSLGVRAKTGIAECDAYFRAAEACFEGADDDLKVRLRESMDRYDNQIEQAASDVAKQTVGIGCSAAQDSLKDEPGCE